MATTTPDNLRTPDPGDPYNLVPDLQTLANDVQTALLKRPLSSGTSTERTAFTSTATAGWLWQDTDGAKLLWRKDGASWTPAVWRWTGTSAQMTAFAAPNGFEWYNTSDSKTYQRVGGSWVADDSGWVTATITGGTPSTGDAAPAYRKINGVVYLKGNWTPTGNGQTAFTLPTGYRPFLTQYSIVDRAGSVRMVVTSAGAVQYVGPGGDGVVFLGGIAPFPGDR